MNCVKSGRVALAIEPQSSSLLRTDQFTASGRQKKVPAVPGLTSSLFPSNSFDRYFLSATPRPFISRLNLELAISCVHIDSIPTIVYSSVIVRSATCRAITPISLCAASNLASLSAVCVTNVMESAPCATPTCALPPWSVFATSVHSVTTRISASFAVARASVMHSTALNARD